MAEQEKQKVFPLRIIDTEIAEKLRKLSFDTYKSQNQIINEALEQFFKNLAQ